METKAEYQAGNALQGRDGIEFAVSQLRELADRIESGDIKPLQYGEERGTIASEEHSGAVVHFLTGEVTITLSYFDRNITRQGQVFLSEQKWKLS